MNKDKIKRKIRKCKEFCTKNIKTKSLTVWIIINLLYVFISSYLVTIKKMQYVTMSKGFIPLLIVNIIVGIIICIKGYYKKNITHIFIALIILFGIISSIFAINRKVALYGIGGRYEGLFAIIYYFSLAFLSSFLAKKYKKKVIILILLMGAIQCAYAICQIKEVEGVYRMIHYTDKIIFKSNGFEMEHELWATGFTTNPNFFSTYMLLCALSSLGMYLDEKKTMKSIVMLPFLMLFLVGILISNTTSGAVALIAVTFYVLVYCIKNKLFIKMVSLAIIMICIVTAVNKMGMTRLIRDVNKTGQQATEIAKGNIDEKYGTKRIYIWKNTMKIVPKYLLHGVGIDNFYYAFNGKALVSKDGKVFFDKAHNEYLQILVTEGIFCTIAYLLLYATVVIRGVKASFKHKETYVILPVMGYLVQAFFNISVIEVAPIFFVTLGLCMENKPKVIQYRKTI